MFLYFCICRFTWLIFVIFCYIFITNEINKKIYKIKKNLCLFEIQKFLKIHKIEKKDLIGYATIPNKINHSIEIKCGIYMHNL